MMTMAAAAPRHGVAGSTPPLTRLMTRHIRSADRPDTSPDATVKAPDALTIFG
jgi:hypothetical protein